MPQKNFVVFMIATLAILLGWMWLQQQIWPVKPRAKDDKSAEKKEQKQEKEDKKPPPKLEARWSDLPREVQDALLTAVTVGSAGSGVPSLAQLAVRFRKTPEPETAPQTITLGENAKDTPAEKKFFLTVRVTSRGAGVEEVILNDFEAADRLGHPTHKKLDLVQKDPYYPSFLMYHYAGADDKRPVDTLGRKIWTLEKPEPTTDDAGAQEIRFSTRVPAPFEHLLITKVYRLVPREYHVGLALEIKDTSSGDKAGPAFRYQLAGAHGLPLEGEWYTNVYRNAMIGMVERNSLWPAQEDSRRISYQAGGDRVPAGELGEDSYLQYAGVTDQYFAALIVVDDRQASPEDGGTDMKNILAWARPTLETEQVHGIVRAVWPAKDTIRVVTERGERIFVVLPHARAELDTLKADERVMVSYYDDHSGKAVATRVRRGREPHPFLDDITVRVNSKKMELKPGERAVHKFLLYHGPSKVKLLGQMGRESSSDDLIDRYANKLHLRKLTDFGRFGWWTDLIIACTSVMHWLLYLLHFLVGSYGVSILLLTLLVRGLMFPVSRKQAQLSMKMQELAPEMKKLQEKYKNDPRGKQEAMMDLYRKHGVHPLGGCLPLFMQLPVFMGLYYCLQESTHFRLASFLWIDNLAAPDMLIWWGENIPWISNPDNMGSMFYLGPYFNLLPVVAVTVMIFQQKMLTPPPTDEQQEMTQKMMKYMMVFMGIMFYKVAAGLCLYFTASSLWGLAERKMLPKKKTAAGTSEPGSSSGGGKPGPWGGGPGKPVPRPSKPRPGAPGKKDAKQEDGFMQRIRDWWEDVLEKARKK